MPKTWIAILLAALSTVSVLSSQTSQPQSGGFQINTSKGTLPSPPPPLQFDLSSAPVAARQALLPLYQQEYALVQQLNVTKWQALQETLGGFAEAGAATMASIGAGAARVAEQSAASSGQYGAQNRGVNAPLDAQSPAEMYSSVDQAMKLLLQIDGLEKQISRIQQSYGINPSLRSPWSALFPDSRYLTPDEVTKLLMPAAKNAAKQLTPDEAKQFLPSVVKDTPKTAVRGSYAYCRGEERACEATCQSGNFKNMAEVVASDKCLNNCAKAFNACMGDN